MTKLRINDPRILALDIRHRRFGFAVFEGPRQLLGWGVRFYPATTEAESLVMSKRVAALLSLYSPSVIVVTTDRWDKLAVDQDGRALEEEILRMADTSQTEIRSLSQSQVRQFFLGLHAETKPQIAASLAGIFPELAARLPPSRRSWDPEHPIVTMFDAIALGLSYWMQDSELLFAHEQQLDCG